MAFTRRQMNAAPTGDAPVTGTWTPPASSTNAIYHGTSLPAVDTLDGAKIAVAPPDPCMLFVVNADGVPFAAHGNTISKYVAVRVVVKNAAWVTNVEW